MTKINLKIINTGFKHYWAFPSNYKYHGEARTKNGSQDTDEKAEGTKHPYISGQFTHHLTNYRKTIFEDHLENSVTQNNSLQLFDLIDIHRNRFTLG